MCYPTAALLSVTFLETIMTAFSAIASLLRLRPASRYQMRHTGRLAELGHTNV
jgi:hypothetical protein